MQEETDRELLELAALAAGVGLHRLDTDEYYPNVWNPLINDGDALRLAVKLRIIIDTSDGVHVQYIIGGISYPITIYEFDCIYETTRRAIVMAAAELARNMK